MSRRVVYINLVELICLCTKNKNCENSLDHSHFHCHKKNIYKNVLKVKNVCAANCLEMHAQEEPVSHPLFVRENMSGQFVA